MPEIVPRIAPQKKQSLTSFPDADAMYKFAHSYVEKHRRGELETCWGNILSAANRQIDQHHFLREFLWIIYVSGFSAKTISAKYDSLLRAHRIENAKGQFIPITKSNIRPPMAVILEIFKNKRKAEFVQFARRKIFQSGWDIFHAEYVADRSPVKLDELPGVGPALACHLARNLGNINICKPDVHLKRIATHYGSNTVEALCKNISSDPIGKTDLILWLAAIDNGTT